MENAARFEPELAQLAPEMLADALAIDGAGDSRELGHCRVDQPVQRLAITRLARLQGSREADEIDEPQTPELACCCAATG